MSKTILTTRDVIAAAVAANRLNSQFNSPNNRVNDGYTKYGFPLSKEDEVKGYAGTKQFSKDAVPYVFANKELIMAHFGLSYKGVVQNIPALDISEEDYKYTDEIMGHYESLTFKALADSLNGWEKIVYDCVLNKETPVAGNVMGAISSLPHAYRRDIKREQDRQDQRKRIQNSVFVGTLGEREAFTLTVITFNRVERFDCYACNAYDENDNLVMFFTGKSQDNFGKKFVCEGRVKNHRVSNFHGGKETQINYVRVKKVIEGV